MPLLERHFIITPLQQWQVMSANPLPF